MAWKHTCYHCQYGWDAEKREAFCPNCGSIMLVTTNFDALEKFEKKAEETKDNKKDEGN